MFKRKNPSVGVGPAKLPRNAFDLSERSLYSQPCGLLLPVFVKDMNPDKKINLDIASQLQAQTLKGRAFVGMQQQFAAYYVPYRYLYSFWDSVLTGLSPSNTIHSSSVLRSAVDDSNVKNMQVPTFSPYGISFSGVNDICGYRASLGYARISEMLGYGNVFVKGESSTVTFDPSVLNFRANAFRWLAYQKIYQDHFLDDRFEQRNVGFYNADDYTDPQGGSCYVSNSNCFMPRYAKYSRDFLSNLQPSPLFLNGTSQIIKSYVGNSPFIVDENDDYQTIDPGVRVTGSDGSEGITAASIRNLFALDRMAQITGRAAKTYRAQMQAHYGVNVDGDATVSKFCGGFSRDLDSTAVIATSTGTSAGDDVSFGQQGSFIDNVSNGHIEYESKDFGVFMVLSWISPTPRWDAYGIDPFNCKLQSADYYHPEFADLGMQPLYDNYLNNLRFGYKGVASSSDTPANIAAKTTVGISKMNVYGWTERYAEYKSSFDKIHGEFASPIKVAGYLGGMPTGSMSFLTTHSPYRDVTTKIPVGTSATVVTPPLTSTYNLSLSDISINPSVTDDIVEVKYDGHQYTDPFRVETMFNCSMLRNMSVSGLPRL